MDNSIVEFDIGEAVRLLIAELDKALLVFPLAKTLHQILQCFEFFHNLSWTSGHFCLNAIQEEKKSF